MFYFFADDEKFDGYDSFDEAVEGQDRLRAKGYADFSGIFKEKDDEDDD